MQNVVISCTFTQVLTLILYIPTNNTKKNFMTIVKISILKEIYTILYMFTIKIHIFNEK